MSAPEIKFEDGAAYDQMMGVWTQFVGSHFLKWLDPEDGLRWLDVGCGTGAFTQQIIDSSMPACVDGIDPSRAQIEFAGNRSGASMARFRTGDAMALPYEDDAFDIAVMALVIFFVPQPEVSIAEMKRTVRSGGTVGTYVWDVHGGGMPPEPVFRILRALAIEHPLPPRSDVSGKEELLRLWQDAGLRDIEQQAFTVERRFDSFDSFWDITTSSASLTKIFTDIKADLLQEIRQRLHADMPLADDGSITYTAHANAIKGVV